MAALIQGDWTHRRGDRGGRRVVDADIQRPRPKVAWSWRPDHGGQVDQVRIAGPHVVVATMTPRDPRAPGWEHAVIYALDARSGAEVARRLLPDPVPVAAMVVDAGVVHVVATRRGEPIYWYALGASDLVPRHRRIVTLAGGHDDVLDAWATAAGGLWLELETAASAATNASLAYALAGEDDAPADLWTQNGSSEAVTLSRDACAGGAALYAPVDGRWSDEPCPPALSRIRAGAGEDTAWVQATVVGPRAQIHALGGGSALCAVVLAEDPERPDRARVEAFCVEPESGALLWRSLADRIEMKPSVGTGARVAQRPNGEVLFQSIGADGVPCSPLLCAHPDGKIDAFSLGAGSRYVLDAALGDTVLAHRPGKRGHVEVGGFAIDKSGRLLGRRAALRWNVDAGDLGPAPTVYAGGGGIVVRGARGLSSVTL